MGSSQSYLSPEAAITVLVVAGAVGLGYTQVGTPAGKAPSGSGLGSTGTAGKKGGSSKKKKATKSSNAGGDTSEAGQQQQPNPTPASEAQPRVVAFPDVIPGQFDSQPEGPPPPASKPKKAKKKKSSKTANASGGGTEGGLAPTSAVPDYLSESSAAAPARPKNPRRVSQNQQSTSTGTSTSAAAVPQVVPQQQSIPLHLSTTSIDTDGSWTRVGSRRGRGAAGATSGDDFPKLKPAGKAHGGLSVSSSAAEHTSDATPSGTGNSSPVRANERDGEDGEEEEEEDGPEESFLLQQASSSSNQQSRKSLAEKLLPKPRKTGVEDMLPTSDYPQYSRVMRIAPGPNDKPADGFSWGDYEDVRVTTDGGENDADGEDDGWGVVTSKRPKRQNLTSSTTSQSTPQPSSSSDAQTKRQRQNAAKRDAAKSAKADAEADRLATLARHKRELERAKMAEQAKERAKAGGSGRGKESGGMKAVVDEKGKLVWE